MGFFAVVGADRMGVPDFCFFRLFSFEVANNLKYNSVYLDYQKSFWKIGGASRKRLQVLLMRKFFNYTDESRTKVKVEALVMAMTRDVSDIVHNAYVAW